MIYNTFKEKRNIPSLNGQLQLKAFLDGVTRVDRFFEHEDTSAQADKTSRHIGIVGKVKEDLNMSQNLKQTWNKIKNC